MLNTKFWSDGFIRKLKLDEKLFYLYLLTNEHTDICGVYEIDLETMSFESGLPINRLSIVLDSLSVARKILFSDGWIYIKNWKKHQLNNPKVQRGIEIGLCKVPPEFMAKVKAFDSLSIDYDRLSHPNPNPNPNPNSNSNPSFRGSEQSSPTPAQTARDFFLSVSERDEQYTELVASLGASHQLGDCSAELDKFVSYWTELTKDGKRQRWELEKTFEVKRRLNTWFQNIRNSPMGRQSNQSSKVVFIS